jgi:hypothetical protein
VFSAIAKNSWGVRCPKVAKTGGLTNPADRDRLPIERSYQVLLLRTSDHPVAVRPRGAGPIPQALFDWAALKYGTVPAQT